MFALKTPNLETASVKDSCQIFGLQLSDINRDFLTTAAGNNRHKQHRTHAQTDHDKQNIADSGAKSEPTAGCCHLAANITRLRRPYNFYYVS